MQYTLISKTGRVYVFFLKTVAEQFQQAYGGVVVSQQLLDAADLLENGSCATI
jgi:acyl-CoA thioesterase